MTPLWILLAAAAPAAAAPAPTAPAEARQDGERTETLDDLLRRAREARDARLAALRPEVDRLVGALEALRLPPTREQREALVGQLVDLGTDATTLLVEHLDPGLAALEKERFRATQVAAALSRMDTRPVTADLMRIVLSGTREGRVQALRVLEHTTERERVWPELVAFFRESQGSGRKATLRTLVRIGGPERDPLMIEVLDGADAELVDMALEALTESRAEGPAARVGALLANRERAERHIAALVAYFGAVRSAATEDVLRDLVGLVVQSGLSSDQREDVLELVSTFDLPSSSAFREAIEPLTGNPNRKLREGGLILQSLLGERGARKALLGQYDARVNANPEFATAYFERAEVLRKIRDWDGALKDYKKVFEFSKNSPTSLTQAYLGAARCAARRNRLKDARDYLIRTGMTAEERGALRDDPDFAKLAAHNRYGDVFPQP